MLRLHPVRLAAAAILFLLAPLSAALAAEEILAFDSRIVVQENGDLLVTETITVNAEGDRIRRGIYRDFPIGLRTPGGIAGTNSFELVSARRDGNPEKTRIEKISNAVRLYLGDANVFLKTGRHTYEITYSTDRQVRFFDDHDEVFWNATGTEWEFTIRQATATIILPSGGTVDGTVSYTGSYGSTANDARSSVSANGNEAYFETTKPLGYREGMTVGVRFAKGIVAAPTAAQEWEWFLRDRMGDLIAIGGAILVFLYYLWAWMRVGVDPPKETVVPRWDAPQGVSPALANYIWNKGLKKQGFPAISAAAINLAVHGYLVLDNDDGTMTLRTTGKSPSLASLPVGERRLMERVIGQGGALTLDKANGKTVEAMASTFRSSMEKEHRSVYYRHNLGWIIPGVILSVAAILAALVFGSFSSEMVAAAVPLSIFGIVLTVVGVQMAKGFVQGGLGSKISSAIFLFIFASVIINGGAAALQSGLDLVTSPLLIGAVATLLMTNVLFFLLMGAPTPLGQKRTAEVAGLHRYMTVSEQDRLNMLGSPEMSPTHYETLLPYAVALGCEKPWTNAFRNWLAAAIAAGVAGAAAWHGPRWYDGHGRGIDIDNMSDTMGNLAGDLSDSFTAALPRQETSSSGFSGGGGGGGFSGGGGGGGGGGGW